MIERDRSGTLPVRELAALDASGLLAMTVPRKHDGAEVPATVLAEVIRTIAAVDPAIAQIPQGHFLLVDVLAVLGTPEQRRRLFAEVMAGGRLGNGLAERGGQHAQDLQTRLMRRGSAVEVGIAGGALRDAGEFVRTRARPFFEAARAGWAQTAGQDPHTIHRYGQLATRVHAAEALLAAAAATLDEVTRTPRNAAAAARGSLAIAQAKAFGSEVAAEVASDMFALSGASAADERHDLSRHWRNARTHASHDPVAWKWLRGKGAADQGEGGFCPPAHGGVEGGELGLGDVEAASGHGGA